jgi:hypothetical protein
MQDSLPYLILLMRMPLRIVAVLQKKEFLVVEVMACEKVGS